jgi:phosphatidylglycerol:prolipoprotein diacylglycerol transferase
VLVLPHLHIFGITIQTFGVFFALNFIAWGMLAARRLKELGQPPDWAYEAVFAAIVGGLVGARGYYLVQNANQLHGGILSNVFSGSGLIWYGGFVGGIVVVGLWALWRWRPTGLGFGRLADIAAYCLPLGYAIGRIGCQVSGDGDYGTPSHLPWAMGYPHGTVPTPPGVTVQPTPIYETLIMGTVALVLWRLRERFRPGVLFAIFLVVYGLERFLIEFIRRNHNLPDAHLVGALDAAQVESLVALAIGVAWVALAAWRGGLRRAAQAAAEPAPADGRDRRDASKVPAAASR